MNANRIKDGESLRQETLELVLASGPSAWADPTNWHLLEGKHWVRASQAERFWEWMIERGGILIWRSLDLLNPKRTVASPAMTVDCTPTPCPEPLLDSVPDRKLNSLSDVLVAYDREVARLPIFYTFHKGQPFCSTEEMNNIETAVDIAGYGAFPIFEIDQRCAIIMAPIRVITLARWGKNQGLIQ